MQKAFAEILGSNTDERQALYSAVAAKLETRAENVEKDLYVCWVLDFLFNRRKDDPVHLYFKGGTSLSKAYGLIRRFSEDIDIGIFKADLNAPLEADIAALPSITKQQKALAEEVDEAARKYISGTLREQLLKEIAAVEKLSGRSGHFTVEFGFDPYRNKDALDVLVVGYDSAFGSGDGYVQAAVRIEGGARPDPVPVEPRRIVPYVADELPNGADLKFGGVTTVKPERTFWEKVLILHAMTEMTEKRAADNDPGRPVPDLNRYSRHYYDVHQIWRHAGYGENVASMRDLAEACRQHKQLMFRAPDHRYERAEPGTYRLKPTEEMRKKLEVDYGRMSAMIFGIPPEFDEVMASIGQLENFINRNTNRPHVPRGLAGNGSPLDKESDEVCPHNVSRDRHSVEPCLSGCLPHPLHVVFDMEWLGRRTTRGWTYRNAKLSRFRDRLRSSNDFSRTTRPVPPTWRRRGGVAGLFALIAGRQQSPIASPADLEYCGAGSAVATPV